MDAREAVKALDVYSDVLVSLCLLLRHDCLGQEGSEICATRGRLELRQTSKDARDLAAKIVSSIGRPADSNVTEIYTAITRLVEAISQADKMLQLQSGETQSSPNAVAQAIQDFMNKHRKLKLEM